MQKVSKCDTISVSQEWLMCPKCGRGKLLRLTPDTEAKNLSLFCKKCHQESVVNIEPSLRHRA